MDGIAIMFAIPIIIGIACIVGGAVWAFGWGAGLMVFGVLLIIAMFMFMSQI